MAHPVGGPPILIAGGTLALAREQFLNVCFVGRYEKYFLCSGSLTGSGRSRFFRRSVSETEESLITKLSVFADNSNNCHLSVLPKQTIRKPVLKITIMFVDF